MSRLTLSIGTDSETAFFRLREMRALDLRAHCGCLACRPDWECASGSTKSSRNRLTFTASSSIWRPKNLVLGFCAFSKILSTVIQARSFCLNSFSTLFAISIYTVSIQGLTSLRFGEYMALMTCSRMASLLASKGVLKSRRVWKPAWLFWASITFIR